MDTLYLVQGDNGSQVKVTLTRDDTGNAVDLTGSTVTLKFKKKNTATVLSSIGSSVTDSDDLEAGIAVFEFTSDHLDITSGDYVGEVTIDFPGTAVETVYEELQFTVREDY